MIQLFLLKELRVSWYPSPHPKTSLLFPFIRKLFIGSQKVLLPHSTVLFFISQTAKVEKLITNAG